MQEDNINLAKDIDEHVNNFLDAIDPVGLPFSFYILIFIVGLLAGFASYILEIDDAINKERDVTPYPSETKKDVQFRTHFNICNFKNRLILSYTVMLCCAYISYGFGFNLAIVTGFSIMAALFNPSVILSLKNRVPVLVGYFLDRVKN